MPTASAWTCWRADDPLKVGAFSARSSGAPTAALTSATARAAPALRSIDASGATGPQASSSAVNKDKVRAESRVMVPGCLLPEMVRLGQEDRPHFSGPPAIFLDSAIRLGAPRARS